MIIRARAPLRLSFGGGGTDLSPYVDEYGGLVLNSTINLHVVTTLMPSPDGHVHLHSSDRKELLSYPPISKVPLDGGLPLHAGVYNYIVSTYRDGEPMPVTITTYSEAPTGSGLGASSSATVSMLKAMDEYLGLTMGEYDLARSAFKVERELLGMHGGRQDQYASAFGGCNLMEFHGDERVTVNPLRIRNWIVSELEASTILHFTGTSHDSGSIIVDQKARMEQSDTKTLDQMHAIKNSVIPMKESLLKGHIQNFGKLLDESWRHKRETSSRVSSKEIDALYEGALKRGAFAGKLSGAGGGGFMMLVCEPCQRSNVADYLMKNGGQVFNFKFDPRGAESWRVDDGIFRWPATETSPWIKE